MSRRDPEIILRQMLDFSRKTCEIAKERRRRDLDSDLMLNLALTRAIEIIGEAASRMPSEFKEQWPSIPWSQIVGMRNRLIHGYDIVNLDVVWQVVSEEIPQLMIELETILTKIN